MNDIVQVFI